ncbi:repeat set, removed, yeast-enriched transcript [Histoplasma capsulatum var. duboisii H88]|uniref:Repeat set, removed, yeast-enriched transcript n=1 Tax=Ajellomyces capsulatus (strain H88) TaxID=544711 RepID=A0A8A1LB13_AJEC8|nr:repeat set, removed, yeast-enriched transcript [Histoplasma capsulatum var. duboisii H88]
MKLFVAIVFDLMISAIASRISVSEAMKGLEHDPNGLVDIGDDGILRSFDSRGTVIDYRRLTTDELHSLSKDFVKGNDERLLAMWANVDSSLVDEEQIWNPRQDYIKQFVSEAATGRLKSRAMRDSLLSPREPHCTDYTCWSHSECEGRKAGAEECHWCTGPHFLSSPHCSV